MQHHPYQRKSKGTKCWCSEVAESPHHKLGQSRAKPCIWHRQNSPLPWAPALSVLATSQWPFWVSDPYSSGTLFLGAKPVVLTFRSLYRLEAFFSFSLLIPIWTCCAHVAALETYCSKKCAPSSKSLQTAKAALM